MPLAPIRPLNATELRPAAVFRRSVASLRQRTHLRPRGAFLGATHFLPRLRPRLARWTAIATLPGSDTRKRSVVPRLAAAIGVTALATAKTLLVTLSDPRIGGSESRAPLLGPAVTNRLTADVAVPKSLRTRRTTT